MILYLYPNGDTTLTAIMSMLGSESTDSATFNWFTKGLPEQDADVIDIFLEPALETAYTNGGTFGDTVYVQVSAQDVEEFRVGHGVELAKKVDMRFSITGKVVGRAAAGAKSYLAVKLLETPSATFDLTGIDYVSVISSINAEGATMPDAISYDAAQHFNNTQIFRTPLSITRTAKRTRLRYGTGAYEEAKRECLELHALELEWAFLFQEKSATVGANGHEERTTRGLIKAIQKEQPNNFIDFRYDPAVAGQTWAQGGAAWLDSNLEKLSNYGTQDKMALHGGGVSLGIQDAVRGAGTQYQIENNTTSYGLKVKTWDTPNLTINMKKSPLFSRRPTTENMLLIFEPRNLRFRYIDDTFFVDDPEDHKNRNNSKDGTEEEFITEAGLEYHHLQTALVLNGIGQDSTLVA